MTEKSARDVIARAVHDHWQGFHRDSRSWDECCRKLPGAADDFRAKAEYALTALRDAGYRVVPYEPSERMMRDPEAENFVIGCCNMSERDLRDVYQIMVAAAEEG